MFQVFEFCCQFVIAGILASALFLVGLGACMAGLGLFMEKAKNLLDS